MTHQTGSDINHNLLETEMKIATYIKQSQGVACEMKQREQEDGKKNHCHLVKKNIKFSIKCN